MSGFVPLQKSGSFHAGVLGVAEGCAEEASPVSAAVAPEAAQDEDSTLPRSVEELEALLTEVREQTRIDAEAALDSVRAQLETEREQLNRLCEQMNTARSNWTNEVRNVLGELVVVGVRQVVSDSAELQADLIRDRLAEVGERLLSEQHVTLRVRPEDEDVARTVIGNREGWQIVADSDLSGGVLAETEGGKVDATLGAALTGLTEAVQVWQGEGPGEE